MAASAVNWIDVSAREGRLAHAGLLAPADEVTLGWDVAGTVSSIGAAVSGFAAGDTVIGLRDLLFENGTHAESVVLDATAVARAPRSMGLAEAATLPLAGSTASQALDLTGAGPGQTVLVTGAAGGVGGFTLELARLRHLRTVAVVRSADAELARDLGAAHVVTDVDDLGHVVRAVVSGGVDAVIDAANLGIVAHNALRARGTFVALVRPFAPPPIRGTRVVVQEVYADSGLLTHLAALADAGHLTPRVAQTFALVDAVAAYRQFERGGNRGRVVLTVG